jgi:single stranded DNA-binding protein
LVPSILIHINVNEGTRIKNISQDKILSYPEVNYKPFLMGRLTREPDVRYSQNADGSMAVARYTLAVDRRRGRNSDNEQSADFISCVAFGRSGEFAEKYLHQGTKIVVTGRIQTGSYTNKDGQRVYTTDVYLATAIEPSAFCEYLTSGSLVSLPIKITLFILYLLFYKELQVKRHL